MRDRLLVLVRDPRGSLVHVRHRETGECLGCIEVGLFELLRSLILAESAVYTAAPRSREAS